MIPKQMMKIIFNNQSQKLSFSFCKPIYKKSILTTTHIYSFSEEKSDHPKDEKKIAQKTEQNNSKIELSLRDEHEIEEIQQQQNKKYSIVKRNYNQTQVPGTETRKYTNLTDLQKDIIANNKFDLLNPQIIPKSGSVNSYIGIKQNLTEISLGSVKVKADDQVFLSQVDPHNIPADLKIRFDSEKQLKIVGKQSKNNKKTSKQDPQNTKMDMAIQSETIEQKTISEHMQQQLGVGVKGYKYFNIKRIRRWDILLTILSIILLMPVYSTFEQLYECYSTTSAIQEQRMKEIKQLKQRSFKRVLFENKDFNKIM